MNAFTNDEQNVTQDACRVLGAFRRRLRDHSMTWEDMEDLGDILDWVEEYIVGANASREVISMTPSEPSARAARLTQLYAKAATVAASLTAFGFPLVKGG